MAHCDRCERWFVHDSALEQHLAYSNSHWACDYCDLDFETFEAQGQHYMLSPNHDMEDPNYWACYDCDLNFESYEALKQHYRLSPCHHYCKKCDRHFKFEESRRKPIDVKHWHCRLHDRVFKSESGLHSHYQQSADHRFSIECDQDSDDEGELWGETSLVEDQHASTSRDCHELELLFDSYPELRQHDHQEHDSHTEFGNEERTRPSFEAHELFDSYPELQQHDHQEHDSHTEFGNEERTRPSFEAHELFDIYPELQQHDHQEHDSYTEFGNEEWTRPSFEAHMAESSSSTAVGPSAHSIKLLVIAVNSLVKRDIFSFPNPFAVIRIDGFDVCHTAIVTKTLSPFWNETFDLAVRVSSTIQIHVFDHRKFNRSDQGFLGSVSITVGDVLNLNQGGSINQNLELQPRPHGKIVRGNLMFSLTTEGQDSPRRSQPPQQLDLAQAFNDMRISPSSTIGGNSNTLPSLSCSSSSQLPTTPYGRDRSLTPNRCDYQRKLVGFRSQPEMRLTAEGKCDVCVRRGFVFEDSFAAVTQLRPEDLRKRLMVKFEGEDGLDYGGVAREWFLLLSREMFNPSYGLFEYSAHDNYTLQINPASGVNAEHLDYFRFIGRVLGLAVFHNRFLDAYFVPGFYKVVLEKKVTLKDLEAVDDELHKSLTWMLENNITGLLEETFSVTEDRFGEHVAVELRPGGATQDVTEANKKQYVDLVAVHRITGRIAEQFRALMEGLGGVLPLSLLRVFDEHELELLIGGMTEIDMDNWMQFTEYRGYERTDRVIEWFWACLRSWPAERKARLLQFTTGTSRVPVNGFEDLQGSEGPRHFMIEKSGDPSGLPRSHTCFNRLDLPPYENYESLERKLRFAIEETEGFGQE